MARDTLLVGYFEGDIYVIDKFNSSPGSYKRKTTKD